MLGFSVGTGHGEAPEQPWLADEGALRRAFIPLCCSATSQPGTISTLDRDQSGNPVIIWLREEFTKGLSTKSSKMLLVSEPSSLASSPHSELHGWAFLLISFTEIPTGLGERLGSLPSLRDAHGTSHPFLLPGTLPLSDIPQLYGPQPALQTPFLKALEANRCGCRDNEKVCK